MRVTRPKTPPKMQPPMTPMIDCTFNLLIFFILTPSFSLTEGYLTTNLPTTSGPVAGKKQIDVQRIKIELLDEGPKGERVSIVLNDNQNLGDNFDLLRDALKKLRDQGLPANHPVLLSPTMACRHKYVVKGFDQAVYAGFSEIHFAVPYQ
jgi:biopolymer transport protein ExbD